MYHIVYHKEVPKTEAATHVIPWQRRGSAALYVAQYFTQLFSTQFVLYTIVLYTVCALHHCPVLCTIRNDAMRRDMIYGE